jgi:hypothetical protein
MSTQPSEEIEVAFDQAGATVAHYLGEAFANLDQRFGEGYAHDHPALVGAYLVACTKDVEAMLMYRGLCDIAEALGSIEAALQGLG